MPKLPVLAVLALILASSGAMQGPNNESCSQVPLPVVTTGELGLPLQDADQALLGHIDKGIGSAAMRPAALPNVLPADIFSLLGSWNGFPQPALLDASTLPTLPSAVGAGGSALDALGMF
jgi:hypothetical protein